VRIVAGRNRGARIGAPRGAATRPTSDRAREAAFNLVGPVDDAAVLDLYAGSGALGLEALSRGARSCLFVESDRQACAAIEENLRRLRASGATVRRADAMRALADERRRGSTYDLVLADPPYDMWGELAPALGEAVRGVLGRDGLLVVECPARVEPQLPFDLVTSRRYGSARITLFRR
jgi:16S rRNA (guanine966-N2)-methyltransferase